MEETSRHSGRMLPSEEDKGILVKTGSSALLDNSFKCLLPAKKLSRISFAQENTT
jgi:hypothetical protein